MIQIDHIHVLLHLQLGEPISNDALDRQIALERVARCLLNLCLKPVEVGDLLVVT